MRNLFKLVELFAFLLPALPSLLYVRLAILFAYFIAHSLGAQYKYKIFKESILSNYNDPPINDFA